MANKITIKYFSPRDIINFRFRDREELQNILSVYPDYFVQLPQMCGDNVYCIYAGPEPLIILGWANVPLMSGAEFFMFASEMLPVLFSLDVYKKLKQVWSMCTVCNNRVTAQCYADSVTNRRFIENFGFRLEGVMRKASMSGRDMCIYGWIKKEEV